MKLTGLITFTGALMTFGASHAANLVSNGDFSMPNTGGGYGIYSPAQSGGWVNATDSGVEIGASDLYGLPCIWAGCQNLEVNANTFGDVSQVINGLVVGQHYTLSYDYGGRTDGGPQALDVYLGGTQLTTDTGSAGAWTLNTFGFSATAVSETLEFKSRDVGGSPSYGNEITNVSIATPEPATWALMLFGFAGMGGALRRRQFAAARA